MDLISRQAAIDAVAELQGRADTKAELKGISKAWKRLKALPSAQPEIIRCKDCRFYEWMSNRVPEEQAWYCHNWNTETGKDDYCSYADMRGEEDEMQ